MIVCRIDGARPRSMPEAPARAALSRIGTALYRTYLDRLAPRIPSLIGTLAERPDDPPDLLRLSSTTLADLLSEVLDELPPWATPIGLDGSTGSRRSHCSTCWASLSSRTANRMSVNRGAGELVVHFGGDHHQAARFEKLVPSQALKGRLADAVKLDLAALAEVWLRGRAAAAALVARAPVGTVTPSCRLRTGGWTDLRRCERRTKPRPRSSISSREAVSRRQPHHRRPHTGVRACGEAARRSRRRRSDRRASRAGADGPALALEAGRRGLVTAVPALEELCRRFAGFGLERAVPERVAGSKPWP